MRRYILCDFRFGQVILTPSMGDDFETISYPPMSPSDALPHVKGEAKRAPAALENGPAPPQLSAWDPSSRSFAEQWSPASTVRSTPPFDSQQMSPVAQSRSSQRFVDIDLGKKARNAKIAPSSEAATRTQKPNDTAPGPRWWMESSSKGGRGGGIKQATAWLRRVRVAPTSRDSTPRERSPPGVRRGEPARSSALGGTGPHPSDPTRARIRREKSCDIMAAIRAPSPTVSTPIREVEAEVDVMPYIEEGQVFAATKGPVAKPVAVTTSSPEVAVIASAAPVACGLVLPCPPSDAEKVMHISTPCEKSGGGGGLLADVMRGRSLTTSGGGCPHVDI